MSTDRQALNEAYNSQGTPEAKNAFVKALQGYIRKIVFYRLRASDKSLENRLLQKLLAASFRGDSLYSTFVDNAILTECAYEIRQRVKEGRIGNLLDPLEKANVEVDTISAVEDRIEFKKAMKVLDVEERAILKLSLQGWTSREIATQLGSYHQPVLRRLARIYSKLTGEG